MYDKYVCESGDLKRDREVFAKEAEQSSTSVSQIVADGSENLKREFDSSMKQVNIGFDNVRGILDSVEVQGSQIMGEIEQECTQTIGSVNNEHNVIMGLVEQLGDSIEDERNASDVVLLDGMTEIQELARKGVQGTETQKDALRMFLRKAEVREIEYALYYITF